MKANRLTRILADLKKRYNLYSQKRDLQSFYKGGMIPWSRGYDIYKWNQISKVLSDLNTFLNSEGKYGFRIDERIIEYPWVLSRLGEYNGLLLDAGATLNHKKIVDFPSVKSKDMTICTYFPEENNFIDNRISYIFSDLRSLPFKDKYFDYITCISTLEHIDMDNSMYGYEMDNTSSSLQRSFSYLDAVKELARVLNHRGRMFVTVPYGRYEKHGFFQQFDHEMINELKTVLEKVGIIEEINFFKYTKFGWKEETQENCEDSKSYNPHSGEGNSDDFAAHSRSICCLNYLKK